MKSPFKIFVALLSILPVLENRLNAQVTDQAIHDQVHNTRKWFVSFTASAGISSIGRQMESSMLKSGFGDTATSTWDFFGLSYHTSNDYPDRTSSIIPWDIEIRRSLSAHRALAFTFSNSYHALVEGYNLFGYGGEHFLTLDTRVSLLSVDYVFTLPDSYSGFRIGPALAIHHVTESGTTMHEQAKTTFMPGLELGFDAALFEKKSWFMAFSMGGTLLPSVAVGPYSRVESFEHDGNLESYTSTYKSVKINLSSMKIGITMGWRL